MLDDALLPAPSRAATLPPDEALLARFRSGDRAAFDLLYNGCGGAVLAFCRRLCASDVVGDDLAQDVWCIAYRSATRFRRGATLLPWLLGIAVRRDRERRRAQRPAIALTDTIPDARPSHDTQIADADALDSALASLPDSLRVTFLLTAGHGLTAREAADALGVPIGTVKWRAAIAAKRLRVLLADSFPERVQPERTRP